MHTPLQFHFARWLAAALALVCHAALFAADRPNIVFIMADDRA